MIGLIMKDEGRRMARIKFRVTKGREGKKELWGDNFGADQSYLSSPEGMTEEVFLAVHCLTSAKFGQILISSKLWFPMI